MKLKAVVTNLDDVEEQFRGLYVATKVKDKDGNETEVYQLDAEGLDSHTSIRSLKNAYTDEQNKRKKQGKDLTDLQAKYKRFEDLPDDFDLDRALELLAGQNDDPDDDPDDNADPKKKKKENNSNALKNQFEARITNMTTKHEKLVKEKDDKINELSGTINRLIIDDGLTKALVEVGVDKRFMKASHALLRSQVTVTNEDGEYKAIVETSDGGPVALTDFVKGWAETEEGKAFIIPAEGAGAGGGKRSGGFTGSNPWKTETRNLTEQAKILRENPKLAERLKKEAGVRA